MSDPQITALLDQLAENLHSRPRCFRMSLRGGYFDYNSLTAKPGRIAFVDEVEHEACRSCGEPFKGTRMAKDCRECAPAARARTAAKCNAKTAAKRRAAVRKTA